MRCFVLVALVAVAYGIAILPEDVPRINVRGECPSGLPLDGLFNNCELSDWRLGTKVWGAPVDSRLIDFPSSFLHLPSFLDFGSILPDNTRSCSIRLPSDGVVFQHMPNILYAHYRLTACAKVHGATPCRVEVRNSANHVVDHIEFRPSENSSCTRTECVDWKAVSGFQNMTIRYEGLEGKKIFVVDLSVLDASFSNFQAGLSFDITHGKEFTLLSSDFGASEFLPSQLVFFSGEDGRLIDIISLTKDRLSYLPGQRFGDEHQFLIAKLGAVEGWVCPVSESADSLACACVDDKVPETCEMSLKGFTTRPGEEYYIGMSAGGCDCSFDSICLQQVQNEEGYFGVPWILTELANSTSA